MLVGSLAVPFAQRPFRSAAVASMVVEQAIEEFEPCLDTEAFATTERPDPFPFPGTHNCCKSRCCTQQSCFDLSSQEALMVAASTNRSLADMNSASYPSCQQHNSSYHYQGGQSCGVVELEGTAMESVEAQVAPSAQPSCCLARETRDPSDSTPAIKAALDTDKVTALVITVAGAAITAAIDTAAVQVEELAATATAADIGSNITADKLRPVMVAISLCSRPLTVAVAASATAEGAAYNTTCAAAVGEAGHPWEA